MQLNFQRSGQGFPLIILHGLFGSLENWGAQAKQLSQRHDVIAVDLRNHGRSPHAARMDYSAMAEDLIELMERLQLDRAHLLGHSMGGKAAMQLALTHPDRVERLIVVDIAPVAYPPHHEEVFAGLDSIDLSRLQSRREADAILSRHVSSAPTRAFLLKNLYRDENGHFAWRMNLPVLEQQYDRIAAPPKGTPYTGPVLFIKGGESDYIAAEHREAILTCFPAARFKIIAGAGHLPHVEKPATFTRLVENFLTPDN
ncbi:MAG: alpha/beta fold hydrolase [Pseudomonadota bacterium]|jgi:esterase|nr:alpha/beta fold hydrolase [Pseudomonadota bacterium]